MELSLPGLRQSKPACAFDTEFISMSGHGIINRRRTLLQGLRRTAEENCAGPHELQLLPDDLRYRPQIRTQEPQIAVFLMLDASGSMNNEQKTLGRSFFLLLERFLQVRYPDAHLVYILHNTIAWEVTTVEFHRVSAVGGTICSTAFALAHDIITDRHATPDWSIHLFYLSDGGNTPGDNHTLKRQVAALQSVVHSLACIDTAEQHTASEMRLTTCLAHMTNDRLRLAQLHNPTESSNVLQQLLCKVVSRFP
jgi:uncharacterized sporulation protein YeaH/YhbH (DUF444 family)